MKKIQILFLVFSFFAMSVTAQRDDRNLAPRTFSLKNMGPDIQKQPITTSFSDADTSWALPLDFGDSLQALNITDQPKNILGAYLLCPGFYQMVCRSYCIKAGTYGPSSGDSYLYAALKGPKENLMRNLLIASEKKGNVNQKDLQLLFWAIIAKTKFSDLNPHLQAVALMLLTPAQVMEFSGGALGFVPQVMIDRAIAGLPAHAQKVIRAENEMRQMFKNANATYQQYENLAVLSGMAPVDHPAFRRGRWCKHPGGFLYSLSPRKLQ